MGFFLLPCIRTLFPCQETGLWANFCYCWEGFSPLLSRPGLFISRVTTHSKAGACSPFSVSLLWADTSPFGTVSPSQGGASETLLGSFPNCTLSPMRINPQQATQSFPNTVERWRKSCKPPFSSYNFQPQSCLEIPQGGFCPCCFNSTDEFLAPHPSC